ncbi:IRK-interacting protein [Euphorbia lathyris]|uniref:IRK-interacting protein n=1 Tax=Euphorbia lathyris TaxID=212925 RepID=UPI00331376C1
MAEIFQNFDDGNSKKNVSREEIQSAIAKAVELRALHAALIHGNKNSPSANLNFSSSSPLSHSVSQFTAQDYPVFTPSYEDETLPGVPKSRTLSETWSDYGMEFGNSYGTVLSDFKKEKKGTQCCVDEDEKSVTGSCGNNNNITLLHTSNSPGTEFYKSSRRTSLTDFKSESENVPKNSRSSNIVVPWTDSHSSLKPQQRTKGMISRLFPKLRKKQQKNESSFSPIRIESEDFGVLSIETLKRELSEANENRDAALMEVSEMKSSLGELRRKLEFLENHCEELKKDLKQAKAATLRGDRKGENLMPVTEEVMVEGFLQIVSEARLSVKQFCKILVGQIEDSDSILIENLNLLLQPYKLNLTSRYSKVTLYHLEAIINQTLYQDFENPVFQKNGSPKNLDPQLDRQAQFASFVGLRNLSWNEVLRKGTKYYSEEFSKFCDQKMSCIITTLNWTRPWPEQLLQAFFVAAKCIWLLHLLAFSFNPNLGILRVEDNRNFDANYMEDMFGDRQRSTGPSRVKIMVMPGFYVQDRVLRCKVLCRFKSVA